jgi:hypothetical protein
MTSPSRTARPASAASIWARRIRWTQKVHFSITPRSRTVTSGFFTMRSVSVISAL